MQLDDLDFAALETTSAGTGLRINRKKTKLIKMNATANTPVTVDGESIRGVESFSTLEAARQEQLSSCSKTSGHLAESV